MAAKQPVGLDAMRAALEAHRGPEEPKRKKKRSVLVATAEQRQALQVLLKAVKGG